ncbi:putative nucleotidyltransferase [Cotonvirus japonicus]|uniref:Nucleotidyltransferase n=1 Tax=Cotonvirus japonicus TaxID=2811091 RepID=A0ABM7NRJ9_9VIRU|nr:putative nucleotidyltransferase [Cotonvirus japonicus]BCS82774.1 putative nucleotidyltransferase [Cotonvirus japonicus]
MSNTNNILDYLFRQKSFIFGGYVYKHTIRGESTEDIDVAVPNDKFDEIIFDLQIEHKCKILTLDRDNIKFAKITCNETLFDIQDQKSIIRLLSKSEIELTRLILSNHDKFMYITDDHKLVHNSSKIKEIIGNTLNNKINSKTFKKYKHQKYFQDWSTY